jgi:heme a synthase
LLVFGASVRVHGAGLACPDWPLCFGEVVPQIDFHVGLEFGHRVVAGLISLGFLSLGVALWSARREVGRGALVVWGLAAAALVVQIVLGGLTVLELLAEWTVTSHLLTGNTFCLLLFVLTLVLRDRRLALVRAPLSPAHRAAATAFALLVPVQLGLGGILASSYAGLACGTWPTCDGTVYFPTFSGPVGWQVLHRLLAYALLAFAMVGAVATRLDGRAGRAWGLLLLAVTVQGTIGVANVLLRLPVEVTLLHSAGAAGVVLAATWLTWESWRAPALRPAAAGVSAAPALEAR